MFSAEICSEKYYHSILPPHFLAKDGRKHGMKQEKLPHLKQPFRLLDILSAGFAEPARAVVCRTAVSAIPHPGDRSRALLYYGLHRLHRLHRLNGNLLVHICRNVGILINRSTVRADRHYRTRYHAGIHVIPLRRIFSDKKRDESSESRTGKSTEKNRKITAVFSVE